MKPLKHRFNRRPYRTEKDIIIQSGLVCGAPEKGEDGKYVGWTLMWNHTTCPFCLVHKPPRKPAPTKTLIAIDRLKQLEALEKTRGNL